MQHTFWICLMRCANMKWIRQVLLKIQSGHDSVHRRTDGRTDGQGETSIPPFQLRWSRGYNNICRHAAMYLVSKTKLEQLEPLRSEDTPAASWLPIPLSHIGSKSKEDKVKVTNLKNSPKFQIYEFWNKHYTRHTFWSCLIRCANMKWIQWVFLKIQSGHDSVHRRTDRQGETSIPPFQLRWSGGIMILQIIFFSCCAVVKCITYCSLCSLLPISNMMASERLVQLANEKICSRGQFCITCNTQASFICNKRKHDWLIDWLTDWLSSI